ncbi:MAG: hypothetical protein K8J31_20215 [Anaerolineae bacterium]|nr:hypothetical protein [Anaerolineae bacterium]
MKKNGLLISLVIVGALALGIGAVAAQGNGNGPGTGAQQANNCASEDAQCQAYNYGGIGFVNGQTGARWNNQERGSMRSNGGTGTNGIGYYASLPPAVDAKLSDAEIAAMTSGWLDEQHAYTVYAAILEQFGDTAPFVNIQLAEAQHIAAWELQFDRYGIALPGVPEFEVPVFASLSEACQTAAAAEIANFELYDTMLATLGDYPDMVQVVTALRNASEFNHLPAFQSCAA